MDGSIPEAVYALVGVAAVFLGYGTRLAQQHFTKSTGPKSSGNGKGKRSDSDPPKGSSIRSEAGQDVVAQIAGPRVAMDSGRFPPMHEICPGHKVIESKTDDTRAAAERVEKRVTDLEAAHQKAMSELADKMSKTFKEELKPLSKSVDKMEETIRDTARWQGGIEARVENLERRSRAPSPR